MAALAELRPAFDQSFMDRVELIGLSRNDLPVDRLFEPGPLKHRRLEDRGRRVGIVFQEFRRPMPVEIQVEPAVETAFIAMPAFRDQRPVGRRYLQALEIFLIIDGATGEIEAMFLELVGRAIDDEEY